MKKYEYTVFGTATTVKVMKFDEFPKPGQTTPILNTNFDRLYYGGKAWNIVYDLMMLGLPVYPVLAYSDARFEPEFQRAAERFQMPTDGIFRSPQGNYEFLTCYVLEDKHKDHITLGGYHSNAPSLDLAELKRDHVPVKQDFLSDSRMALLTCPKAGDLDTMFSAIVDSGLPMVFSMSHDLSVFNKENLEPILKHAKVIFANAEEVSYMENLYGYCAITDLFRFGQTEMIIKTMGAQGSVVYVKDAGSVREYHVPITSPATQEIRAIGAGDAYVAGFLYGMSQGCDPVTCAQYGSTVSSFIIEDDGSTTNAPTLQQMLARNAARPDAGNNAEKNGDVI